MYLVRGPPFNHQGGGGGLELLSRTNDLFQPRSKFYILFHVYIEQFFLTSIIYFMQNLPEIIYLKNTLAIPLEIECCPPDLALRTSQLHHAGVSRFSSAAMTDYTVAVYKYISDLVLGAWHGIN